MKRLIVCFDGTWNAADSEKAETNVARIRRAIRANSGADGIQQVAFYERGVGTTMNKAINLLSGATGLGVGDNIRSAYINIAQNYVPGDELFLFGFSRGAFSARSLAGLISACGLLKRQRVDDIHKAWTFYREAKDRNPKEFVKRNQTDVHEDVTIKFLGVWDTVGALGVPVGILGSQLSGEIFEFHDTSPSRIVKHASHALAIDERRDEFVPTLWTGLQVPRSSRCGLRGAILMWAAAMMKGTWPTFRCAGWPSARNRKDCSWIGSRVPCRRRMECLMRSPPSMNHAMVFRARTV
jgi:uncharacterized protein (DUF2235 family)